jgi:Mrp family chromosome partitioning ATPase
MRMILEQTEARYDFVIVDSPTLLNMADSRILASYVNKVVLIVRSRTTPKVLAQQACANVSSVDGTVIGAVLNCMDAGDSDYSYTDYSYPKHNEQLQREEEQRAAM